MKNKIFLTAAASLLALSLSTGASAALIDGSLAYSTLTGGSAWSFDHGANTITVGTGEVDYVSGDLAGPIALGDTIAALPTFTYDAFVPSVNIWNLGGFSFDLDSVTSYTQNPNNAETCFGRSLTNWIIWQTHRENGLWLDTLYQPARASW